MSWVLSSAPGYGGKRALTPLPWPPLALPRTAKGPPHTQIPLAQSQATPLARGPPQQGGLPGENGAGEQCGGHLGKVLGDSGSVFCVSQERRSKHVPVPPKLLMLWEEAQLEEGQRGACESTGPSPGCTLAQAWVCYCQIEVNYFVFKVSSLLSSAFDYPKLKHNHRILFICSFDSSRSCRAVCPS